MSFVDRVVLVTGASAGIGAAIAESFAGEGANVVLVGRDESRLNDVANLCQVKNSKCNTQVIRADISIDEDAKKVIDEAVSNFGRLDVLVNNAGIGKFGCLLDGKIMESFDQVMRINLRAHVYITSLAAPYLIKTKGNVINISSVAGSSVPPKTVYISYYLSKAALDHFTRCAAAELAAHNVRVNTISPGPVNTDITAKIANSDASDTLKTMMDQVTEPKEVADLVMFLASDKGKSITGANYIMDSGCLLVNH